MRLRNAARPALRPAMHGSALLSPGSVVPRAPRAPHALRLLGLLGLALSSACSLDEFGAEFGQPASGSAGGNTAVGASGSGNGGAGAGGNGGAGAAGASGGGPGIDPHNVAIHPSFEESTEPWLQEADGAADPLHVMLDDAPHGLWVAQAVEAKLDTPYFHLWDDRTAVPATVAGRRYTASVYARAAVSQSKGKPAFLYIREWDVDNDVNCSWTTDALTLDDVEWRRFEISGVALHSDLELDVTFAQLESVEGDSYYLDLFQVVADPADDGAVPASCDEAGGDP